MSRGRCVCDCPSPYGEVTCDADLTVTIMLSACLENPCLNGGSCFIDKDHEKGKVLKNRHFCQLAFGVAMLRTRHALVHTPGCKPTRIAPTQVRGPYFVKSPYEL